MNATRRTRWMILAATAAIGLFPLTSAQAQVHVRDAGTARDANPRVGSAGYNTTIGPAGVTATGNRIVTGNVTGGREFRGFVPYVDPQEFRGNIASRPVDDFIKNSSGAPYRHQRLPVPGQSQAFYGAALAAPPPPGFARNISGTYTPVEPPRAGLLQPQPGASLDIPQMIFPAGQMLLLGPVDPLTGKPSTISPSPLLGMRSWRGQDLDSALGTSATGAALPGGALDRLGLDDRAIRDMRAELARSVGQAQQPSAPGAAEQNVPGSGLSQPAARPFDAPEQNPLTPKPLGAPISPQSMQRQTGPIQAVTDRLTVPPRQQSSQFDELERRLTRYYTQQLQTDEARNRELLSQIRAHEEAQKTVQKPPLTIDPQTPAKVDFGIPDYAKISKQLLEAAQATSPEAMRRAQLEIEKPKPVQIKSLAEGVRAEGLATVLRRAEDQMKEGKFIAALDQYAVAEQVAPNNPLIRLGQAHAELGAGYYRRAESHLRQALSADPQLMMGQYDLKTVIGQQRLEAIVKDLKETAQKQEDDPGHVFLLAYLAYNTGNERQAAVYLDLAEKRSGGRDEFFKLLRLHWTLPEDKKE